MNIILRLPVSTEKFLADQKNKLKNSNNVGLLFRFCEEIDLDENLSAPTPYSANLCLFAIIAMYNYNLRLKNGCHSSSSTSHVVNGWIQVHLA